MSDNQKLTLSHQARMDIAHYIRHCNEEIGGFGYVTMNDDGNFFVDEIFLVEQSVSGTSVDFADTGLEYAITKAAEDNRLHDLKFCWHSHVNMGAFWSSTDDDMIEGMNNGMTPYIVSLVQNKKNEHKARVDFFPPAGEMRDFTPQVTYELDLYHQLQDIPEHIIDAYDLLVTRTPDYPLSGGRGVKVWPTTHRNLSDARKDYLKAKVRADGFNALSSYEKDDYDDMLGEEATNHGLGTAWDSYYDYDDDEFDLILKQIGEGDYSDLGIDETPLSNMDDKAF